MKRVFRGTMQLLIFLVVVSSPVTNSLYATEVTQEYQLKAAYLYNFARFIRWPERSFPAEDAPLNMCIIGENPFADILSRLESKKIGSHPLKIHYLKNNQPQKLKCHIAFLDGSSDEFSKWHAVYGSDKSVYVSNGEEVVKAGVGGEGADIGFVLELNKLRFVINNSSINYKGLQTSASLLELALKVY